MRRWAWSVVIVWAVEAGALAAPLPLTRDPLLVVRVYRAADTMTVDTRGALEEARAILQHAGLDVRWTECTVAAASDPVCDTPLGPTHLAVRVIRSTDGEPAGPLAAPLGDALVDRSLGAGTLATVYLDRVNRLAQAGHANLAVLAGRAMAHEVGHLLLGTAGHARVGLMRGQWTRVELQTPLPGQWLFTARDARSLRLAVAARLRSRLAATAPEDERRAPAS